VGLGGTGLGVDPEDLGAPGTGPDEPEQAADRGRLARAIGREAMAKITGA
jgi:hypothetical protein